MKLTIPHWIIVAMTLVGSLAPQIAQAFPSVAPYMTIIAQICTLAAGALGVVSGSALAKEVRP